MRMELWELFLIELNLISNIISQQPFAAADYWSPPILLLFFFRQPECSRDPLATIACDLMKLRLTCFHLHAKRSDELIKLEIKFFSNKK